MSSAVSVGELILGLVLIAAAIFVYEMISLYITVVVVLNRIIKDNDVDW